MARSRSCRRSRAGPARAPRTPRRSGSSSSRDRAADGAPAVERCARQREPRDHRRVGARRGASPDGGGGRAAGRRAGPRGRSSRSAAPPRTARRGRARAPSWSITSEWPSNTSSSWPPTSAQNATAATLSRARWTSIRSRSAPLPAWYGEAEMLTSSVAPASASSDAGGPGSQMSSQTVRPTRHVAELEQRPAGARLEVALLVEHAVVRQEHLAVDRLHRARRPAPRTRCRRRRRAPGSRRARRRRAPSRAIRSSAARASREEVLLEQQVLGRVAGHAPARGTAPAARRRRSARAMPRDDLAPRCRRCRRRSG